MDKREELRVQIWRGLSGEARRVLVVLSSATAHKSTVPQGAVRELSRVGLVHESEHRIRALWIPPRALYESRARAFVRRRADVEELASARVDRAKSNAEVRPVDLLRAMARDIETGKLKADRLLLIYGDWSGERQNAWEIGAYRCNLRRDEELVLLDLMREKCMRKWLGDT